MFQPFQERLADHRIVVIPSSLQGDDRARFVTRIAAATRQQAGFAAKSDAVLQVGDAQPHDDYILIPHESAAPLDPSTIEGAKTLPSIETLWWLTWSTLSALRAAAAENSPHGGIQPASVFVDAAGRVKLSDFGVAPAYETLRGVEHRRQVHCDGMVTEVAGRGVCSGTWSMLAEDETREYGWIAPFFGHELLEGVVRLNPKADQFALGVVLFLLATGTHPYGVSANDPTQEFYNLFDPYNVADERRDWKKAFENAEKNLTQSADKPILAWAELSRKLLASDPGGRFANAAEAEKTATAHVPAQWALANDDLRKALGAVREGDAEGALGFAKRWSGEAALPELWRTRLGSWLGSIEAQKEQIAARRRLGKRLAEAQAALNAVDLAKARKLATEVRDAAAADDSQRRSASELLDHCDQQEQVARRDADKWMAEYLEAAALALEQGDLKTARDVLQAVAADPAAPPGLAAQARDLLTDIELRETRLATQQSELETARAELKAGQYEGARQRLETLLATADLTPSIAEAARPLLSDLERRREMRASGARTLEEARGAWERGDAESLAAQLAKVPADFDDAEIAGMRGDLESRLGSLRGALLKRSSAETALAKEQWSAARSSVGEALAARDLPQRLRDELTDLQRVCEQRVADAAEITAAEADLRSGKYEALRTRLERLQAQAGVPESTFRRAAALLDEAARAVRELAEQQSILRAAQEAAELGDATALEARLAELPAERVLAALAEQRAALAARSQVLQDAGGALDEARAALGRGDAEAASAAAGRVLGLSHVPPALRIEAEALQQNANAALDQARREFLKQIETRLSEADQALTELNPKAARAALEKLAASRGKLPPETAARIDKLSWRCERCEQAQQVLARVRDDLKQRRFAAALKLLDACDTEDLPPALVAQIAPLRAEVVEADGAARADEERRLLDQVETARTAAALGDLDSAEAALAQVEKSELRTPVVQKAAKALRTEVAALRPIAAALEEADRALADAKTDPASVLAQLGRLPPELPDWARARADGLRTQATEATARRKQQALATARQHLVSAKSAIEQGDAAAAESALRSAAPDIGEDATLREAATKLRAALDRLSGWLKQASELQSLLERGAWTEAIRGAEGLAKQEKLPAPLKQKIEQTGREAGKQLAAHVQGLEAELASLATELEQRGRRARKFEERLAAVAADPHATAALRERITNLESRFAALPQPKGATLPMAVGGGLLVLAIGAGGYFLFAGKSGGGDKPDPNRDPNATIVEPNKEPNRPDPNRPDPNHKEPNKSEPNVVVSDPNKGAADPNVGPAAGVRVVQTSPELARLAGRIEQARARLQQQLDEAWRASDGATPRDLVRISISDDGASVSVASADGRRRQVLLPRVALDALDSLALPGEWLGTAYPAANPPPAPDATALDASRKLLAAVRAELNKDAALAGATESLRVVFLPGAESLLLVVPERPQGVRAPIPAGGAAERVARDLAANLSTQAQAARLLAKGELKLAGSAGIRAAENAAASAEFRAVAGKKLLARLPIRRADEQAPGAGVWVSGELDVGNGTFTPDEEGRAQLAWYLGSAGKP